MKLFSLTFLVALIIGASYYMLCNSSINNRFSNMPADDYFLTPQHGHLGEGINEYKLAMGLEMKKMKKTRAFGNEWQVEGPHNTGGRINCVTVHPNLSNHYFVGTADGGIFKSINAGNSWAPIFDNEQALSISSIVFDTTNPQIIYAGTGDQVVGGYSHNGNGIYKSTDGGNTWSHKGLGNVGTICKIIIDPSDANILYVGTTGNMFTTDIHRGVYKSTDGGNSWSNILFLGPNAGIGDLVIHPTNTSTIYATGRRRIRSNVQSIITGPEARIYRSTNGGITWDTLNVGLPTGAQSRIGLAISKNNPNLLYANYVDSTNLDFGGLYKSTNGGNSWSLVTNSGISMGGFGWYFGEVRIDPNNDNTIYILSVDLYKSIDGGASFDPIGFNTHADKHDLFFLNSNNLLLGTDGGFYSSSNAGDTWTLKNDLPITQFYEVAHNPFDSLNYYGGAQDNGTNYGSKSQGLNNWIHYFGGDGFRPQFSKTDDMVFYASWQNGNIVSTDDGGATWNNSFFSSISNFDRTSWNTPYLLSTHNDNILYAGTFKVYKNTTGPVSSWSSISPDLTDGTPNSFHVITTLDQSTLNSQVLYAGTSDARVHRTLNNGGTWTLINTALPNRNVSCVTASPNNANNVFVSMSGYRNNDSVPHIYWSQNQGTNWTSIAGDLPNLAINDIWVLKGHQDSCIVVANDGGVYASKNLGVNWERVGTNMPLIPVFDLDYNPSTRRLIAGTFARALQTIEIDSVFNEHGNSTIGVSDILKQNSIQVYPNPANSFVCINALQNELQSVHIFDFQGRFIMKQKIKSQEEKIDVQYLKGGMYIFSFQTAKGIVNKPVNIIH